MPQIPFCNDSQAPTKERNKVCAYFCRFPGNYTSDHHFLSLSLPEYSLLIRPYRKQIGGVLAESATCLAMPIATNLLDRKSRFPISNTAGCHN